VLKLSKLTSNLNLQILRWFLIGISTFLLDFFIFIILLPISHSVFLANFISGLISISFNYIAHYKWTFKSSSSHQNVGARYFINIAFFWFVSTSLIKLLISFQVRPEIAKIVPLLTITPFSYFILKRFVFKDEIKHL